MKAPKFKDFITEKVERSDIQVAVLTKVNADSKSVVSNMILRNVKEETLLVILLILLKHGCQKMI